MSNLLQDAIFWIETDKIKPNPFQPRRDFDVEKLGNLAESIRQYGVLQPLTVSRIEVTTDAGMVVEYELIAGERRLRAAKIAGIATVPVVIRIGDDSMRKLELAIIENLQREDLNPIDRARAFLRLVDEFKFTHTEIGKKVGKSREYVSNTLRLLQLPEAALIALAEGKITEGHTRPLLMLIDRPDEQLTLFKEIIYKRITVREAEGIARRIATDRARKKTELPDAETAELERTLQEALGTRVKIEKKNVGGQIRIDFFSQNDLRSILEMVKSLRATGQGSMLDNFIGTEGTNLITQDTPIDDRSIEEKKEDDTDLYNIQKFSI